MLLAVCLGLYIANTPEYALKGIIEDVNTSGKEGLYLHLTGKAKKTLESVSSVVEDDLLGTVMDFADWNSYAGVLKSEIQEIQWKIDDVLKNNENAAVILLFSYKDKLIGSIEISMTRDEGEWKIDGIEFPKFTEINW